MIIRHYEDADEAGWVRCRTLAFLYTAHFDNVLNQKKHYKNPSIELVAEIEGQIVGLIDVEYENKEGSVCFRGKGLGGMIWHIAVHPDLSHQGIGETLLKEAEDRAIELGLNRFEAWTRDDGWVQKWYGKMGFSKVDAYYHVDVPDNEMERTTSNVPALYLVNGFAHYTGEDNDQSKKTNKGVLKCVCYEKYLLAN